jgi:hypothetical protein
MIGPILFILLIVVLASLPAFAGWRFGQRYKQSRRMACAILAGQSIVTPGVILIAYSGALATNVNLIKTIVVYAAMTLMVSITTFVILEMKKTRHGK